MHRDKTLARIVLILSILHGALAAPAVVRKSHLDADEGVAVAYEKRGSDKEPYRLLDLQSATPSESSHSESEAPRGLHSALELEARGGIPGTQQAASSARKFLTDDRKTQLKIYGGIGATLSLFAATLYGLHKLVGPGSEPATKPGPATNNPPNSTVVGRSASMHPRSQKQPVSHALDNLRTRNEDSQLLEVSRALERLD